MARVFIDGQAGTTGLQIHQRLKSRQDIELLSIREGDRKDPECRARLLREADVAILCLPDPAAKEAVELADDRTRLDRRIRPRPRDDSRSHAGPQRHVSTSHRQGHTTPTSRRPPKP